MVLKDVKIQIITAMKNNKEIYVKSKANMADDIFRTLHNRNFSFEISNIFNDNTLSLFKNLKKKNIPVYKILLQNFLNSKKIESEMEKLIWTSEFLEFLNNNHDSILGKTNEFYKRIK